MSVNGNYIQNFFRDRLSIDISDPTQTSALKNEFGKNVVVLSFILTFGMILYYASGDKQALSTRTYLYTILLILPIFIGSAYYFKLFGKGTTGGNFSLPTTMLLAGFAIFAFLLFLYYYGNLSFTGLIAFNYLFIVLVVCIIIVGLAIAYYIFGNYLKKQTGIAGFLIHLIFYIPCAFSDFIIYLREQWKITPNIVFLLFFIELVLIALYYILPSIANVIVERNTTTILRDPVFLSKQTTIAGNKTFILADETSRRADDLFINNVNMQRQQHYKNNNYAISAWVYINSGTSADQGYATESTILDFAGGRPKLTYVNSQSQPNTFTVYLSNATTTDPVSYTFTMELQKWNYVVFNYHDSQADFLVNGILKKTLMFDKSNIPLNFTILLLIIKLVNILK
jgi:hypothetical protein